MTATPARRTTRSAWRALRWVAAGACLPLSLWACNDHPLKAPEPVPEIQIDQSVDVNPIRKLDLLFMIDNSDSMKEEQDNLARNFPLFIKELRAIKGGLPDIRIAIISSDVGAGNTVVSDECFPLGDKGRFKVKEGCGLDPNQARFLAVPKNGPPPNFTGELETVFSCMAQLGTNGCGYEHQLQSIRAALSSVNPENANFLRPDAYLGIIILTDEDDCSAVANTDFFAKDIPGETRNFRCATEGHVCDGKPITQMDRMTPIGQCAPRTDKQLRLIQVEDIVNHVKGLKGGRQDRIFVAGIIGKTPYTDDEIKANPMRAPTYKVKKTEGDKGYDLGPVCSTTTGGQAAPGLRIEAFINAFPADFRLLFSICQNELSEPIRKIGELIAKKIQTTCIESPLIDTDKTKPGVQPDCQVSDEVPQGNGYLKQPMPPCATAGTRKPCWKLTDDEMCPVSKAKIDVERSGNGMAATGTILSIKCQTCASGEDPRCKR